MSNSTLSSDNPFLETTERLARKVQSAQPRRTVGRVTQVIGTLVKALVSKARVGEICELRSPTGLLISRAEVIGFDGDAAILSPYGEMLGISTQTQVIPTGNDQEIGVSPAFLGRVLNGMGRFIDGGPELAPDTLTPYPIYNASPDPLQRQLIKSPLEMGVRAIDGLLTIGEGQRMGIFSAAGVGKSTLLSSLVIGAKVDVCVVALIGERGREVREFIEENLGEEGMRRAVLVVSTSDKSSLERARAAYVATAIAEYFRDQGQKVLLLMDSVTRFARALREIGLAAGEPPTRRGFPPSVFATLPKLLERTGMGKVGSITAFYTVLVEGDDMTEPVADETRSILDGHIILSRDLASANHYPAIDVLESASRVMDMVIQPDHLHNARIFREMMAAYKQAELLIKIGEYQHGTDPVTDKAIERRDAMNNFLRQGIRDVCPMNETLNMIAHTVF